MYDCRMFRSFGAGSNIPDGLSFRRAMPCFAKILVLRSESWVVCLKVGLNRCSYGRYDSERPAEGFDQLFCAESQKVGTDAGCMQGHRQQRGRDDDCSQWEGNQIGQHEVLRKGSEIIPRERSCGQLAGNRY